MNVEKLKERFHQIGLLTGKDNGVSKWADADNSVASGDNLIASGRVPTKMYTRCLLLLAVVVVVVGVVLRSTPAMSSRDRTEAKRRPFERRSRRAMSIKDASRITVL